MPTFSAAQIGGALAVFIALVPAGVGSTETPPPYTSATEAYRQGVTAMNSGKTESALPALEYAAGHGVLGAKLRLARLYAKGDSVQQDHSKAFRYYQRIADQYADVPAASPISRFVGEAFCALGKYYVEGIPEMALSPDPGYGAGLLRHAGAYFGDAEAQYQLGRLYLTGKGVEKNPTIAANWLTMAARKQHSSAQAVLGEMLWSGEGVGQRQAQGLALLMLAQRNTTEKGADTAWIVESYDKTIAIADRVTVQQAEAMLPRLSGGRHRARAVSIPTAPAATRAVPAAQAPALSARNEPRLGPVDLAPAPSMGLSVGFGAPDTGMGGVQ
ncbi:MAG: tetratricopeptide repeat protein [Pseudomonadota bacterium]